MASYENHMICDDEQDFDDEDILYCADCSGEYVETDLGDSVFYVNDGRHTEILCAECKEIRGREDEQ